MAMKIMSFQKQTKADQRTRFKAIAAVGEKDGHVGLFVSRNKAAFYYLNSVAGVGRVAAVSGVKACSLLRGSRVPGRGRWSLLAPSGNAASSRPAPPKWRTWAPTTHRGHDPLRRTDMRLSPAPTTKLNLGGSLCCRGMQSEGTRGIKRLSSKISSDHGMKMADKSLFQRKNKNLIILSQNCLNSPIYLRSVRIMLCHLIFKP